MNEKASTLIVSLIDLSLIMKLVHWNCKSVAFYQIHRMMNELYSNVDNIIDPLAEEFVASLGIEIRPENTIVRREDVGGMLDYEDVVSSLEILVSLHREVLDLVEKIMFYCSKTSLKGLENRLADLQSVLNKNIWFMESTISTLRRKDMTEEN